MIETIRTREVVERLRGVNPQAIDALLALAFTAAALWTLSERVGRGGPYRGDDFLGIALLLLQTLPIAARNVAPLPALTISVVAISAHIAIGYEGVGAGTFAALVILYNVALLTDLRRSILGALITAAGILTYFITDRGDPSLTAAISTSFTYAAGWGLGMYTRSRRQYAHAMEERATLMEREREVRAQDAVAGERARIARELHDIVGHALNLIVIQAGGAQRVFESRPELARDSLASIESTGRQALTEMERMLGILRRSQEDEDEFGPQPGLGQVEEFVAQVREAGLRVDLRFEGTPVKLPHSVDLSAYRIIQEALTNALRHAGPAHARVTIQYEPGGLELDISDDGPGAGTEQKTKDGGGRGLIGMRERVALFGGTLQAGPRREGGFCVHATLPIQEVSE